MPTYDYLCQKCERTFEHFQSMTSPVLETCEDCGGKLERLIGSGAGVIFKGSGFYATDYKKSEPKKEVCNSPEKEPAKCKSAGCPAA